MPNQPQPPEGCVYGPFFNRFNRPHAVVEYGGRFTDGRSLKTIGFYDGKWDDEFVFGPAEFELLRVADERDELRAEVERLKAENEGQRTTIAHLHAGTMPTWKDLKGPAK